MRLFVSLLLALGLAPTPLMFSSIAFDAASSGASGTGTATGQTVSHTVTGTETILFTCVQSGTANTPITATYNSVSMTSLGAADTGGYHGEAYYLIAPTSGTHNVVVTLGTGTNVIAVANASYTGAQQSGVPEAAATTSTGGGAGTMSTSTTTVAANAWAIACFGGSANAAITATTGTADAEGHAAFVQSAVISNGPVASPGATTLAVDFHAGTSFGTAVAFSFAPAAGGGSTFKPALLNAPIRCCRR